MTDAHEQHWPTEEQLEGYLKGECSDDQAAAIRAHLGDCPRCRQWIDEARANEILLESVRILANKDRTGTTPPGGLDPGLQIIENYDILEEIGRGGMGVVYKARQAGTKRTVALKVMLEGPLASESARRRFEREIELAASLSHPNIVTIHDSGVSRGRYYFAMDYIEGQRLDRYVKARDLPVEPRLRLMQKICLAVNYAHQHGVIHRDLKPSNILVDADGEPHILDFGLAKPLEPSPQAESLLISISGEVLGTLPYMSPEQALGAQREIDSRTDVYTLGVILYELLTGQYPYPVVGQMAEVLRNIAQAEPARPSTIYRAIRDDLETIVLKTLSKDKEQRYDSAGALAADIGRYMAGEAIEAKRDSGWYVFGKTLRRYKVPVGIAAGLLVAALVVATAMSSLYTRAERERRRADAKAAEAQYGAEIARAATTQAVAERQRAEGAARDLADELHTRRIEQGRSLVLAGDFAQGEYILWREFLQQPGDPQTLWALREVYAQQPCLAKALASTVPLVSVAFAPDGGQIATADVAGAVKLWDVPSCRLAATLLTQAPDITSLAFSPDGKSLACGSSDQTVRLLDAASGRCTAKLVSAPGSGDGRQEAGDRGQETGDRRQKTEDGGQEEAPLSTQDSGLRTQDSELRTQNSELRTQDSGLRPQNSGLRTQDLVLSPQCSVLSPSFPASCRPAYRLAFSPDRRILASCEANDVALWDPAGGERLATLAAHARPVTGVAFSPDGRTLASASFDKTVILWDVEARQPRTTLDSHLDAVSCVAFSPDSRLLASASWDGTVILWQVADGACLASLDDFGCWVHSVAFTPDGRSIAAGDIHGNVRIWDLWTGRCVKVIPAHVEGMAGPLKPVVSLAFSPRGDVLATVSTLGVLKLWDISASKPMLSLTGHAGSVLSVAFTGGATSLSSSGATGSLPARGLADKPAVAPGTGLGAAGSVGLVSRDERGTIRLWDLSTGRCTRAIAGPDALPAPATSPAVDWDNPELADMQHCLAASPTGKLLAWPDAAGNAILICNPATGEPLGRLAGHTDRVLSLGFAPDGKTLASGGKDGRIRLWDVPSLQCTRTLEAAEPAAGVPDVSFSPDGRTVAGTSGKTIQLWNAASGQLAGELHGHIDRVRCVAFSPDGATLASAGGDGVMLWDVADARRLGILEGQAGPTFSLAFSPDGRTLACADQNRTIRLWQIPSGRCLATLRTQDRLAWSLGFSPDGRLLVCAGGGDSLRLFNLAHYDRNVLGNYPFYLELAHRSQDLLQRVNRPDLDRWAKGWAAQAELPLWAAAAAASQPAGDRGVDPRLIADWGQLSRHRLLSALRGLGCPSPHAGLGVAGAMDPPIASAIFSPAVGDTRVHTLLGSGTSPDRIRSAEYQQQRVGGVRPPAATQPAPATPAVGVPPA
jgi:WD40 repeat protein/tRNA A-37 threonylcarbamoyl transferase component Bud32